MKNTIKSVTAVQAYGAGNNGNWVSRVRLQDGREFFAGINAGYSLAQAQTFINNNSDRQGREFDEKFCYNDSLGLPESPLYQPLPDGVNVPLISVAKKAISRTERYNADPVFRARCDSFGTRPSEVC